MIRGSGAKIEASGNRIGGFWVKAGGSGAEISDFGIKIGALEVKIRASGAKIWGLGPKIWAEWGLWGQDGEFSVKDWEL